MTKKDLIAWLKSELEEGNAIFYVDRELAIEALEDGDEDG